MRTVSLVWANGLLSRPFSCPPFEDNLPRAVLVLRWADPEMLAQVRGLIGDPGLLVSSQAPAGIRLTGLDGESWWRAVEEPPTDILVRSPEPFLCQVHRLGHRVFACLDVVGVEEGTESVVDELVAAATAALRLDPALASLVVPLVVGASARLFHLVPADRWQIGWEPQEEVEVSPSAPV